MFLACSLMCSSWFVPRTVFDLEVIYLRSIEKGDFIEGIKEIFREPYGWTRRGSGKIVSLSP